MSISTNEKTDFGHIWPITGIEIDISVHLIAVGDPQKLSTTGDLLKIAIDILTNCIWGFSELGIYNISGHVNWGLSRNFYTEEGDSDI